VSDAVEVMLDLKDRYTNALVETIELKILLATKEAQLKIAVTALESIRHSHDGNAHEIAYEALEEIEKMNQK
jgi:hypothetical protein